MEKGLVYYEKMFYAVELRLQYYYWAEPTMACAGGTQCHNTIDSFFG